MNEAPFRTKVVRKERLELSRVAPLEPKSRASTNSATFAWAEDGNRRRGSTRKDLSAFPARMPCGRPQAAFRNNYGRPYYAVNKIGVEDGI